VYTLVQGDERIVVEFAPVGRVMTDEPEQQQFSFQQTDYVQMELGALEKAEKSDGGEAAGSV